MKVDIICNDGSPMGVSERSIFGEDGRMGVGGAELALLTLCRAWQFYGNKVTLYNDPQEALASSFEQRPVQKFRASDERDVLIIFRSPNEKSIGANGLKVWLSCDQDTVGGFKEFSQTVHKIVTISPRHSKFFRDYYGIVNTIPIDLPVRTWEYKDSVEKISKRCIFTSIPDRGVMELHAAWALILREVPDASLLITSDWRLWTSQASEEDTRRFRLAYGRMGNVIYKGAINRRDLIRFQREAAVHLYPCVYDELFCISVAESQVAGVYPITSDYGALETTNMGMKIHGEPSDPKWIETFVQKAVEVLKDEDGLRKKQEWIREVAMKRFSVERVLEQWDEKVFK